MLAAFCILHKKHAYKTNICLKIYTVFDILIIESILFGILVSVSYLVF